MCISWLKIIFLIRLIIIIISEKIIISIDQCFLISCRYTLFIQSYNHFCVREKRYFHFNDGDYYCYGHSFDDWYQCKQRKSSSPSSSFLSIHFISFHLRFFFLWPKMKKWKWSFCHTIFNHWSSVSFGFYFFIHSIIYPKF